MERHDIMAHLGSFLDEEARTGYPRLSLIPDTRVRKFLHCFRALDADESRHVRGALSKDAAAGYCGTRSPATDLLEEEAGALARLRNAASGLPEFRFLSLKILKMWAGAQQSENPGMKAQMKGNELPEDVVAWVSTLTTAKATELRKLAKSVFLSRFGLRPEKWDGGVWRYRKDGGAFEIELDFGGSWGQQMRYTVLVNDPASPYGSKRLTFEGLLGIGAGDWDFISAQDAERSVVVLADLIDEVVRIATN
jgi:hypothetical protein